MVMFVGCGPGRLTDEPESTAFGSINEGVFDGKIYSRDGVFYVEKASRYFGRRDHNDSPGNKSSNSNTNDFHSVIYKEEHVIDPYEKDRTGMGVFFSRSLLGRLAVQPHLCARRLA